MSLDIGRLPATYHPTPAPVAPTRPVAVATPAAAAQAHNFDTIVGDVPPAPTEEVRTHVERAAQIAQDMADRNRELHFTQDAETGRVIIQVRDLQGTVIRTIPPSHALDMMSGAVQ
jgi:FlaG protein